MNRVRNNNNDEDDSGTSVLLTVWTTVTNIIKHFQKQQKATCMLCTHKAKHAINSFFLFEDLFKLDHLDNTFVYHSQKHASVYPQQILPRQKSRPVQQKINLTYFLKYSSLKNLFKEKLAMCEQSLTNRHYLRQFVIKFL